jgi:hypothetical protein
LPVAVLVWLMIVPMLLKIDLAALGQVGNRWRGIVATVEGRSRFRWWRFRLRWRLGL